MTFLMVDGAGDPNKETSFQQAIEALYGMSYTAKFMLKEDPSHPDYVVPPIEGLWWADDMTAFERGLKDQWQWTLMIMQPKWFTQKVFKQAKEQLQKKKDVPALDKVRLESFSRGRAAQILHRGPYDAERPTVEKLHSFIAEQGGRLSGKHHEIYLSDPRRCAPEKLRTIIRQPFCT